MNLTEGQARSLLAAARVARLATADERGRPHLVPVTFALDSTPGGDRIYIAIDHKPKTTTSLRRLRNIQQNPLVSLLADHYEEDWAALWWVRADGTATIWGDPDECREPIDLLARKYGQYRQDRPGGPVIAIEVTHWAGWAGSG